MCVAAAAGGKSKATAAASVCLGVAGGVESGELSSRRAPPLGGGFGDPTGIAGGGGLELVGPPEVLGTTWGGRGPLSLWSDCSRGPWETPTRKSKVAVKPPPGSWVTPKWPWHLNSGKRPK